jgi:hypothetical protein
MRLKHWRASAVLLAVALATLPFRRGPASPAENYRPSRTRVNTGEGGDQPWAIVPAACPSRLAPLSAILARSHPVKV